VLGYTAPQNVIGLPVCVVPTGLDYSGRPVAVQVTGAPYSEHLVLHVAATLQKHFGTAHWWSPELDPISTTFGSTP